MATKTTSSNNRNWAMDVVLLNVADLLSSLLTMPYGETEFHLCNTYQIKIEKPGCGWQDVWANVSIRYAGDSKWVNCGNRHGGRRVLAHCFLADMAEMAQGMDATKKDLLAMSLEGFDN